MANGKRCRVCGARLVEVTRWWMSRAGHQQAEFLIPSGAQAMTEEQLRAIEERLDGLLRSADQAAAAALAAGAMTGTEVRMRRDVGALYVGDTRALVAEVRRLRGLLKHP